MRRSVLELLLSIVAASSLQAADLRIVSLNTLHYGWGSSAASTNKGTQIVAATQRNHADAVVLQEVMSAAVAPPFPAGTWRFVVAKNSYGTASYQEFYMALFNLKAVPTVGNAIEFPALKTTFSRPPMAVQVTPAGSQNAYYVANFHATWGERAAQRTAEAKQICDTWLPQAQAAFHSVNIALLGDWNRKAAQVTTAGNCMIAALPVEKTTLNLKGVPASAYDHAVSFQNSTLTLTSAAVDQPALTPLTWRTTVSDHWPIIAVYTY